MMRSVFFALFCLWLMVTLACNLPILSEDITLLTPPSLVTPSNDLSGSDDGGSADIPTTEATFVLAPTATPRGTPNSSTNTNPAYPPIALDYRIRWQPDSADPNFAFANVSLIAEGGDGNYTFYRDGLKTTGATFQYRWGSCKANPGTFRVESGDGQSVTVEYEERSPCP